MGAPGYEAPPAPPFFLVIDLEATCDDRGAVPKDEMETIEIGAVLVDGATLAPVAEHQSYVRPVRHPVLTPFCTHLTTILQADVDAAPSFPEAIDALGHFVGGRDALFSSWGAYDRRQLEADAHHHGVVLPFRGRHLDVKERFSLALGTRRRYGLGQALERAGLTFAGTPHRGLDDARNVARLLPWALGRVPRPPRR